MSALWAARIDALAYVGDLNSAVNGTYVLSATRVVEEGEPAAKRRKKPAAGLGNEPRIVAHDTGCVPLAHVGAELRLVLTPRAAEHHYDIVACVALKPARLPPAKSFVQRALADPNALLRARLTRVGGKSQNDTPLAPDARRYADQIAERAARSPTELASLGAWLGVGTAAAQCVQRAFETLWLWRDLQVGAQLCAASDALLPIALHTTGALLRRCSRQQLQRLVALATDADFCRVLFADARLTLLDDVLQRENPFEASGFYRAPLSAHSALAERCTAELRAAYELHGRLAQTLYFGNTVALPENDADAARWLLENNCWRPVDARSMVTVATAERARAIRFCLRTAFATRVVLAEGGLAALEPTQLAALLDVPAVLIAPSAAALEMCESALARAEQLSGGAAVRLVANEVLERQSIALAALLGARRVILAEAQQLGEHDLAVCVAALADLCSGGDKAELVLVGDRCLFAAAGAGCGAPLADVAASGAFWCDEQFASADALRHSLHRAALDARSTADGAHTVAHALVSARAAVVDLWHLEQRQWLVLGTGRAAMQAALTLFATEFRRYVNLSPAQQAALRAQCDCFTLLAARPGLLQYNVLANAPFVAFRGAVYRVAQFYRVCRAPNRGERFEVGTHFVAASPKQLVSLDAGGLLLALEGDATDHRTCCDVGIGDGRTMLVARHRNELVPASFVLARSAVRGVSRLAPRVAFVAPSSAALASLCWTDVGAPMLLLPDAADVALVASPTLPDPTALLVAAALRRARKPLTALADALAQQ